MQSSIERREILLICHTRLEQEGVGEVIASPRLVDELVSEHVGIRSKERSYCSPELCIKQSSSAWEKRPGIPFR
jgi:hypothetical protein